MRSGWYRYAFSVLVETCMHILLYTSRSQDIDPSRRDEKTTQLHLAREHFTSISCSQPSSSPYDHDCDHVTFKIMYMRRRLPRKVVPCRGHAASMDVSTCMYMSARDRMHATHVHLSHTNYDTIVYNQPFASQLMKAWSSSLFCCCGSFDY